MKRNHTADLLKGIAVILMIQVHLMELFARQDIFNGFAGHLSLFLGGSPAAPVFMAVMGYFIAASSSSFPEMVKRGIKLIGLGFILNIALNFHLLIMIADGTIKVNAMEYILGVDILFLAGLSIIILAVMNRFFKHKTLPFLVILVLILAVQFLFQQVMHVSTNNYFVAYFYGDGAVWSYFPLIPWLVYPVTGYLFYTLDNTSSKKARRFYPYGIAFSGLVTIVFLKYALDVSSNLPEYYHHGYVFYFYTVCFLIFWTFIFNRISRYHNLVSRFLEWIGRNVTSAYVIQWVIIGNIATSLYKTQGPAELVLWFVFVVAATGFGVLIWRRVKRKHTGDILKV